MSPVRIGNFTYSIESRTIDSFVPLNLLITRSDDFLKKKTANSTNLFFITMNTRWLKLNHQIQFFSTISIQTSKTAIRIQDNSKNFPPPMSNAANAAKRDVVLYNQPVVKSSSYRAFSCATAFTLQSMACSFFLNCQRLLIRIVS